jgi:hypothetical protein
MSLIESRAPRALDSTRGASRVLGSIRGGGIAVDTVAVDFVGEAAVVLRSCRF